MSLIKLAALGAEVLDILDRNEEWNSDTFDLIQTRISLLGLCHSDDEGMFKVDPDYKDAAFHLYEDYKHAVANGQQLCLTLAAEEKTAEFYPGAEIGKTSGVSVLIKNGIYEL